MTDVYSVHNAIRDVMCSRCRISVKTECFERDEETRMRQMCICIKEILEPNDQYYPTKFGRRQS